MCLICVILDTDSYYVQFTGFSYDQVLDALQDHIDFSNFPTDHVRYSRERKAEFGYVKVIKTYSSSLCLYSKLRQHFHRSTLEQLVFTPSSVKRKNHTRFGHLTTSHLYSTWRRRHGKKAFKRKQPERLIREKF